MYQNTSLQNYLEQSSSINLQSLVLAEWNLNYSDNIALLGNYRNRPNIASPTEANFGVTALAYDATDVLGAYTGATDSNILIHNGLLDTTTNAPNLFITKNKTESILYSLTDCVGRFRPRSGINKLRYFKGGQYVNFPNQNMFLQPRYYIASKDDKFKYWSSYRIDGTTTAISRGIATTLKTTGEYYIDDAAPFVVYTTPVPANRIVVKMQTHASDYNSGTYKVSNNTTFADPFYESPTNTGALVNQKTPEDWKIQYLDNNNTWQDATVFTSASTRSTGKRIIGSDGYVELAFGLTNTLPTGFRDLGQKPSLASFPVSGDIGDAYLVPDTGTGTYYVWNGTNWTTNSFVPTYGWYVKEEGETLQSPNVTKLTSPDFYGTPSNVYTATYREFQFIKGLRIIVNTMSKQNSSFELIEMSPRLTANISDRVKEYSVTKIASDIGNTGIPVGELSASNGNLSIFDYDQSLNPYNDIVLTSGTITGSLISDISSKNLQVKFYEQIIDDRTSTIVDYFVPIKTYYADGFPSISNEDRSVSIELRDLYFYFESLIAPSLLLRNVKLSKAIATMLDNVGFSNYKFYKTEEESEDVIPYFYVAPDTTVAEVLNQLAQSTQSAMFFDEDNNFIVMSKNYIMPTSLERSNDIVLYGTKDFSDTGVLRNGATQAQLANIMSISSENNDVFNGGKIIYSNKYIQKSYGTIKEASLLNNSQSYKYKPVLLWEVSGTEALRPTNEEVSTQSSYTLSAMPLNVTLSSAVPSVSSGAIIDNIIDFGQSIYWLTRYEGYFYANGEIIKYKGVEHTVQSSQVTGLGATLVASTNTFTLTSGNIYSLAVGQKLTKTSGAGAFGVTTIITGIDRAKKIVTLSSTHGTPGAISFVADAQTNNVWVENLNDYQKYFAQIAFNGKMFPTGRVKIYAEPKFDGTGAIIGVAKHGRGQFGTKVTSHNILDTSNYWLNTAYRKAFKMQSKWMFKDNHQYTQTKYVFTGSSGTLNGKTITLGGSLTTGNVEVGWIVTAASGVPTGTVVETIAADKKSFTINKKLTATLSNATVTVVDRTIETLSQAAISNLSSVPDATGLTKDMFDTSYFTESPSTTTVDNTKPNGSVAASALTITGVSNKTGNSNDYLSYIYKDCSDTPFNTFGTRMKILGKQKDKNISGVSQIPIGADAIDIIKDTIISGTGGGIAVRLDVSTNTNTGYYFEIDALTSDSVISQTSSTQTIENIPNVYFYKVLKGATSGEAVPVTLWYGSAPILVDTGLFSGMGKIVGQANSTVYDLSIKVENISKKSAKFYLYLNNKLIATVQDNDAIPDTVNNKNFALFVRGAGKCMFDNVYAISDNPKTQFESANSPLNQILSVENLTSDSYRKYLVNPGVIESYLTGITTSGQTQNLLYYEEFGTIMRECAYFNVKYDKAYPALYSKISPTFNDLQGYVVSGFRANPYSAEFLVFNVTDFALNLDETSGNYLRIQGITFTQQADHELTVDEFLSKTSSLDNYNRYSELNNRYVDIQNSRNTYGKKDFTLSGTYIQNLDMASNLMQWMVDKVMVPKKAVSVEIFANPMIQLGDIVTINYTVNGTQQLPNSRFVVYHIEYKRGSNGPSMTLYLDEVI
jgi:hypothetical protein